MTGMLASYFVLAFLFTRSLLPLASRSIAFSLAALCGPAAAAIIVSTVSGRQERSAFLGRVIDWRLPARWYLLAVLLPLPITLLRSGLEYVHSAAGPITLQPITALNAAVFLLIVGEEAGWRGFALPHLLRRVGPWRASGLIGLAWAGWHLPLFFMPGMPQFGSPFPAFALYTVALSVILTCLAVETRGSVIIATLFHGAVNTFGFVNPAASPTQRGWSNAICYGLAALAIGTAASRRRAPRLGSVRGAGL
jgi:membrane protease YdiL (CAAX protease family)